MKKKEERCPYWDKGKSHQCRIVKGGLYIPMPQHVEVYCSTPNYTQCPQYVRGHDSLYDIARKYGFLMSDGRRRYRRVAENIVLSLSSCDESGGTCDLIDEEARITDLSLGGFRVKARQEIPEGTLVVFNFGEGFSHPDTTGRGEVRWSEHRGDGDRYQAGIAFTDLHLSEAVGEHMGLPMR